MPLFLKILLTTISIFGIVALGGFLRHRKVVTHEAKASLLKLLINVFLPCLIFNKIALGGSTEELSVLLTPLLWGFSIIVIGIAFAFSIGKLCPKLLGLENIAQQRTFSLAIGMQNYGFLALPIAAVLFPNDNIEAAVLIHNVGVELAIWTLGIVVLSGNKKHLSWKNIFNAPSVAIIISLIYKETISDIIPQQLWVAVTYLGAMAIPTGLLSAGFTIAEKWQQHNFFSKSSIKKSFAGISFRLLIIPSFIFLCLILLDPSDTIKKVIIIQLAMPSALAPIYLADYYNADAGTAFQIAITTTIVGLFTIGIWLSFSMGYFNFSH